jgi:hypothetical protein
MGKQIEYMREEEVVALLRKTMQVGHYVHSKSFKDGLLHLISAANIKGSTHWQGDHGVIACGVGAARKYLNAAKDTIRLNTRQRDDAVLSSTEYTPELVNRIVSHCDTTIQTMENGIVYDGSETLDFFHTVKLAKDNNIKCTPMTANDFMLAAFTANPEKTRNGRIYFENKLYTPNSQHSNLFFDYNRMIDLLENLSATMRFTQSTYPETELGKTVADVMTRMAPYVSDYHFDLLGIDAEYIRLNSEAGIPMAIFTKGGLTGGMGTVSASLPMDVWLLDSIKKDTEACFGLLITPDLKVTTIDGANPAATMDLVNQYFKDSKDSKKTNIRMQV